MERVPSKRQRRAAVPDFVLVPNAVLLRPPIRYRRARADRLLSPAEFYVLAAVLVAARAALNDHRHRAALRGGKSAIDSEIKSSRKYFERRDFAVSYGFRAPDKGPAIRQAGSTAYKRRRKELTKVPVEEVVVEVSRRGLLRLAGLSRWAGSQRTVEPTLDRLREAVGDGEMPPPLRAWTADPGGGLRLLVDGAWVPPRRFARVLWPPPKRSPAALALWLLVHVLDTRKTNKVEVAAASFADRIGLSWRSGSGAVNRAMNAAFAAVNERLADIPDSTVRRLWCRKPRVVPPEEYRCEPLTEGKVRVVAEPRRERYVPDEDRHRPVGRLPKPTKRRPAVARSSHRNGAAAARSSHPVPAQVARSPHHGGEVFASADRGKRPELRGFSSDLRWPYKNEFVRES